MQPREKLLAAVVGTLAVGWVGSLVYGHIDTAFTQRGNTIATLRQEVAKKRAGTIKVQQAQKKLTAWQRRGLPADRELARSLYQNWLLALVDRVKFVEKNVSSQNAVGIRNVYERSSFTVTAKGQMGQVVQFLYEFYNTSHLHQIRRLSLRPLSSGQLDIAIGIEGLSLPGGEKRTELNSEPFQRAALDLATYRKALTERNFFADYVPPRPPDPPPIVRRDPPPPPVKTPDPPKPPEFDVAKFAYISAITEADGEVEVWLDIRTTGETLRLRTGDEFRIGAAKGTVERIGLYDVDFVLDGKRLTVALGENLRTAPAAVVGEG